jgi:hypothetical protein
VVSGSRREPIRAALADRDDDAADAEDEDDGDDEDGEAGEGEEEDKGVKKGAAARLIRRLEKDDFYFVPGSARKSSGSFYTREEIVQYLVRKALEGLVEDKSAAEIESLRVIDLACGSAHFLVGAARYMGRKLLDAYHREFKDDPPPEFYPDRPLTPEIHQRWHSEGEAWCKRRIVERCLFGVDLNPTAVQLAQVALWIESLAGDRPLSFFAHHIRPGNSLLGTWLDRLHQPPHPALDDRKGKDQGGLFEIQFKRLIREALDERLLIDKPLPPDIRKDTPQEYEYKADRLKRSNDLLAQAHLLFDLRSAAAFVPEIWGAWATLLSTDNVLDCATKQKWWARFGEVRQRERFFHWELEFPEVFFGEHRGFHVIVGNPPWDKVKPDRKEFYGRADILIRAYTGGDLDRRIRELHVIQPALEAEFYAYCERTRTQAACLRRGGDYHFCDWVVNDEATAGDADLFKFFVERAHRLLHESGRLGLLVPSAIYNTEGCTGVRHLLFDHFKIHGFYGFENRKKIFNIHSSYKFVCLGAEKTIAPRPKSDGIEFLATFMRHDLEELTNGIPPGIEVLVRRTEIERFSPGTLALLEFRNQTDRQIVLAMYGLLPGQQPRPLLGDQGGDAWGTTFHRELHLTDDRHLWTQADGTLWSPQNVFDTSSVPIETTTSPQTVAEMLRRGFWPLFEGKQVEQFVLGIKPIQRWVKLESLTKPLVKNSRVAFRDIASNTNERTAIAAMLPSDSLSGNTLSILEMDAAIIPQAITVLNSLCFDYLTRFKTAGTHLNWTYISRVAVPPRDVLGTIPTVSTRFSVELGGAASIYDCPECFPELWAANKAVAQTYGLKATDFEHIVGSFPVFARKRPSFQQFLRERLAEWKAEEG